MINWAGKRVVVAGGLGQIGSHLSRRLVGLGATVIIADNGLTGIAKNIEDIPLGNDVRKPGLLVRKVDLKNLDTCIAITQDTDYVFQLAANMGGMIFIDSGAKNNVRIMDDNARINMNMLSAAHHNKVSQYFYSSSACIYPTYLQRDTNSKSVNLKESDALPADPNEFYGWEKLFTEFMCQAYQNDFNMNIRIARFHNVFGECYTSFDLTRGKAPCLMIASVMKYKGGDFTGIWGDGEQTRSFLYAEDCVDGILKLMDSDYTKPINIGSDECVTINQLADMVFKIAGKTPDKIVRQMDKPQGVRGRNSDNELVKKVLNWSPKLTLYQGLEKTYQWAQSRKNALVNM